MDEVLEKLLYFLVFCIVSGGFLLLSIGLSVLKKQALNPPEPTPDKDSVGEEKTEEVKTSDSSNFPEKLEKKETAKSSASDEIKKTKESESEATVQVDHSEPSSATKEDSSATKITESPSKTTSDKDSGSEAKVEEAKTPESDKPKKEKVLKIPLIDIKYSEELILVLLLVIAFFLPFLWGPKNFVIFDHSIVVHGAQRILHGQIPQKDFLFPTGPVTLYIQAFLFFIFGGETLYAYIFHAAILNVIVTWLVFLMVRKQGTIEFASCTGLATAVWFYGVNNQPWFDTMAYFFVIVGWYIWEKYLFPKKTGKLFAPALWIGICCAFSFLGKMNIGGMGVLVLASLIIHRHFSRFWIPISGFITGFGLILGGYVLFLVAVGSPFIKDNLFVRPLIMDRIKNLFYSEPWIFLLTHFPDMLLPICLFLLLCVGWLKRKAIPSKHILDILGLLLICLFGRMTSRVQRVMAFCYFGFILGLFGVRFFKWRPKLDQYIICALILLFTGYGVYLQVDLMMMTGKKETSYKLKSANLKPIMLDQKTGKMIDEIVTYMQEIMEPEDTVLCLPNSGILNVGIGRTSDFVLHWYDPGMSYFAEELGDDDLILASLYNKPPTWVILMLDGQLAVFEGFRLMNAGVPELASFFKEHYNEHLKKKSEYIILRLK